MPFLNILFRIYLFALLHGIRLNDGRRVPFELRRARLLEKRIALRPQCLPVGVLLFFFRRRIDLILEPEQPPVESPVLQGRHLTRILRAMRPMIPGIRHQIELDRMIQTAQPFENLPFTRHPCHRSGTVLDLQ